MKKQNKLEKITQNLYNVRCQWIDWIDGGADIIMGNKYEGKNLSLGEARSLATILRREYKTKIAKKYDSLQISLYGVPTPSGNGTRNLRYQITKVRPRLPGGVLYEDED